MGKISGKEYPISKIFSKEFEYYIPSYQRPYSWEETQTETLFDNLYDFYKGNNSDDYFLGSIVLIKEESKSKAEVIDGQQRLTTLTILFATIACKFQKYDITWFNQCLGYIIEPGNVIEGISQRVRLCLRKKDQAFFDKYIQNTQIKELLDLNTSLLDEPQQHIRNNCEVLYKRIEKVFGDNIDGLKQFCTFIATRCFLVVVCTSDQNSAFRIFSVMNSTGLDLTVSDLIKSELIGQIQESQQQTYTDRWEDLEIKTTRQGLTELFSHIRMIFMKTKAKKGLLEELKENVLPKFSPEGFIDQILESYADCYVTIQNGDYKSIKNAQEINSYFMWLKKIENSDWMPCLIKFMSNHKNDPDYLLWFLSKLERLSSYLYITSYITGKDVNNRIERYGKILIEMEQNPNTTLQCPLQSIELTEVEKSEFKTALEGDVYCLTSKRRNYVVLRLDSFVSDGAATYNPNVLTIEHVLPQTVSANSEWSRLWPKEEIRKQWLNKIANLVPLSRRKNSEAQNYDFDKKKSKYFTSNKGTSSYALTTQVLAETSWTDMVVKNRQDKLLEIFKKNWQL